MQGVVEPVIYPALEQKEQLNILVVDGGMRGRALDWTLKKSTRCGNAAITPFNTRVRPDQEVQRITSLAVEQATDLVVIGQDNALAAGQVDALRALGIAAFGPTQHKARIESSKTFMKQVAADYDIPTAGYESFGNSPSEKRRAHAFADTLGGMAVAKDDGLAQGKAVIVCDSNETVHRAIEGLYAGKHSNEGRRLIIEEYLEGRERSGHAFMGYGQFALFPPSEDHKQLSVGDKGPNTGGTGVVTRPEWLDPIMAAEQDAHTLRGLTKALPNAAMIAYPGYKGKLLEVNARPGSPDWEAYCRILDSDFLEHVIACIHGRLADEVINWSHDHAMSLVGMARGYPVNEQIVRGEIITGLELARQVPSVEIFLGSVAIEDDVIYSNGGRLFAITARGPSLHYIRQQTQTAMELIRVGGKVAVFREDIGMRPLHGYVL